MSLLPSKDSNVALLSGFFYSAYKIENFQLNGHLDELMQAVSMHIDKFDPRYKSFIFRLVTCSVQGHLNRWQRAKAWMPVN